MKIIILIMFYYSGYLTGKLCSLEKANRYQQSAAKAEIKAARVSMVIRSYRNQLYRKETELKSLPKSKQNLKGFDYMDVKSKLEIVRKIEEDVANEMQEI